MKKKLQVLFKIRDLEALKNISLHLETIHGFTEGLMGREGRCEQQWVEATALCGGGNSGGCKPLRTELHTISMSPKNS